LFPLPGRESSFPEKQKRVSHKQDESANGDKNSKKKNGDEEITSKKKKKEKEKEGQKLTPAAA
jgi:hypothetical protein